MSDYDNLKDTPGPFHSYIADVFDSEMTTVDTDEDVLVISDGSEDGGKGSWIGSDVTDATLGIPIR